MAKLHHISFQDGKLLVTYEVDFNKDLNAEDIAIYQKAMNHMEVYVETPANDFISNRFMRKN